MHKSLSVILESLNATDLKKLRNAWLDFNNDITEQNIDENNFLDHFQYLALVQALGTCLHESTDDIKAKISVCIQYMLEDSKYKTELNSFINSYCENREGNAKDEMTAFKQLSQTSICEDDTHYSFALYYVSEFTYDYNNLQGVRIERDLWSIVSFAAWFSQGINILETHISDYILGYFYNFCEQETLSKRFFYTDREIIERRLHDFARRDASISERIMRNHTFYEVYNWIHFYVLFTPNARSQTILRLFNKVFLNKSFIIQSSKKENDEIDMINNFVPSDKKLINYYHDDIYESEYQLFRHTQENVTSLDKYPGFVIMLYMLCKELSLEEFHMLFPERKTPEKKELEQYEWDLIPEILFIHNANKGHEKYYDELFQLYESDLLKLYAKAVKDFSIINKKEYKQYTDNIELLNMLLFFCAWENASYVMKDNIYGDIKEAHKTQLLMNPFFEACSSDKWREKETVEKIFNKIAEIFCFTEPSHTFDNFTIKTDKSNLILVNLIYNLSRTENEASNAIKNQINYLREIQQKKIPLKRDKKNLKTTKKNQKLMKKIDKGFSLKNFITQVYPFCGIEFQEYFQSYHHNFIVKRDYICKFIGETDNVFFPENECEINHRETNKIGFTTRYLYKDRNMSTHYARHNSVDSLIKPKNWKSLLHTFSDIEKKLLQLFEETEQYYKSPMTNLKPKTNPVMFVLYYLLEENRRLYNELISKLYSAIGKIQNVSDIKLNFFNEETNSIRDNSETIIKEIEEADNNSLKKLSYAPIKLNCNTNDTFQQREDLFELRLERMLNIMFAVNGNNENGVEHNLTMYDFFRRYHAEIAFYLIYLTGEFSKL